MLDHARRAVVVDRADWIMVDSFMYRLFKVDLAQDFGHDVFIYQGSRLIQLMDLVVVDRMI